MELFRHNCFHLIDQYQLCNSIFEKCLRTLVMSASILYHKAVCRIVGLSEHQIKFIQTECEFLLRRWNVILIQKITMKKIKRTLKN